MGRQLKAVVNLGQLRKPQRAAGELEWRLATAPEQFERAGIPSLQPALTAEPSLLQQGQGLVQHHKIKPTAVGGKQRHQGRRGNA